MVLDRENNEESISPSLRELVWGVNLDTYYDTIVI